MFPSLKGRFKTLWSFRGLDANHVFPSLKGRFKTSLYLSRTCLKLGFHPLKEDSKQVNLIKGVGATSFHPLKEDSKLRRQLLHNTLHLSFHPLKEDSKRIGREAIQRIIPCFHPLKEDSKPSVAEMEAVAHQKFPSLKGRFKTMFNARLLIDGYAVSIP